MFLPRAGHTKQKKLECIHRYEVFFIVLISVGLAQARPMAIMVLYL